MMPEFIDFTGKHILIAGASAGIGRQTAVLLSRLGAKITMIDVDVEQLKSVFVALEGKNHRYTAFDLNNIEDIDTSIKEMVQSDGSLDGFVYCVGIRSRRPLKMIIPKVMNDVMAVNFCSFVEMVRSIVKKGRFKEGLSIVGISSVSAHRGAAGVTAYAASKGAMESAVRCMAKELASRKVRINTVVPAQINTPAYEEMIKSSPATEDGTLLRQYLGLGEPGDVAAIIAFLLSNQSRFISGASLPVDGGYLTS